MELQARDIFKDGIEVLTAADFASKYGGGVKPQSIYYAMQNGHVDYYSIGRQKLVVMTEHTQQYKPNENSSRQKSKKKTPKRKIKK